MTQQPPWTAVAVHDTVAAIVRQRAYDRSFTESLWDRLVRWIADLVGGLLRQASVHPELRYVAMTAVVVVLLVIIVRLLIRPGSDDAVRGRTRARLTAEGNMDALRDAERLAAIAEYTLAAHRLYAAVITALAARGDIRVHESKTTGDYARELQRRRSASMSPFARFRERYDRVIYGDLACTADDYATLSLDARHLLHTGGDADRGGRSAA